MATDIPATIMVVFVAPSQTIRRGASADLGRLFSTTRYGSRISDSLLLNHRATATSMLMAITSRKLRIVSYSVTPRCTNILLSRSISQKQSAILEGLLKIKESMIPTLAVNSQINKKLSRISIRDILTIRLCRRCISRYFCCPADRLFICIQLLPYKIKICFEFRGISPVQRGIRFQVKDQRNGLSDGGGASGKDDDPVCKGYGF